MRSGWIVVTVLCIALSGCGASQPSKLYLYEVTDMTDQEKDLMMHIAVDKQLAAEGIFDEWEHDVLKEVRAGNAYLREKYPTAELEIVGLEAATSVRTYDTFTILEAGDDEHYYEMHITPGIDKKSYDITDDYYGKLICEDAQAQLMKIVNDAGLPCLRIKAYFDKFLGKEYGVGLSVADILSGRIHAGNSFQIYLAEEKLDHGSYKSNIQEVKTAMQKSGIVGYFTVVIGTDDSKESVYRESFSL